MLLNCKSNAFGRGALNCARLYSLLSLQVIVTQQYTELASHDATKLFIPMYRAREHAREGVQ